MPLPADAEERRRATQGDNVVVLDLTASAKTAARIR
jgi:hypothetical protein